MHGLTCRKQVPKKAVISGIDFAIVSNIDLAFAINPTFPLLFLIARAVFQGHYIHDLQTASSHENKVATI